MTIKVAIAGVGNCACAFVQGLQYYGKDDDFLELMHPGLGIYTIRDIEIVAAFDVNKEKVGKDLAEAIFAKPNNAAKYVDHVKETGVTVQPAPVMNGISPLLKNLVQISDEEPVSIRNVLEESGAEMLINLLPTGANEASKFYAEEAIAANCAFINCTPTLIASDEAWGNRFKEADLPVCGDDLQSQIGGTVFHKGLLELLVNRGVHVSQTYQLDISGTAEGITALDRERRMYKRKVKTDAIKAVVPHPIEATTGSTDYVDFMQSRRTSYFWIDGKYFLGAPIQIDIFFRTEDSANGAGTLMDVVRGVKIALDRKVSGPLISVSAFGFKKPPLTMNYREAIQFLNDFVAGRKER